MESNGDKLNCEPHEKAWDELDHSEPNGQDVQQPQRRAVEVLSTAAPVQQSVRPRATDSSTTRISHWAANGVSTRVAAAPTTLRPWVTELRRTALIWDRFHLESLCRFLREEGNHVVQTMFGGSIEKGTYVTGLSDVDVLLIVNESSLVNQPPAKVKNYVRDTVKRRLPNNPVQAGKLAVTVNFSDKTEIQMLPAIRTKTGGFGSPNTERALGARSRTPRSLPRSSPKSTRREAAE